MAVTFYEINNVGGDSVVLSVMFVMTHTCQQMYTLKKNLHLNKLIVQMVC